MLHWTAIEWIVAVAIHKIDPNVKSSCNKLSSQVQLFVHSTKPLMTSFLIGEWLNIFHWQQIKEERNHCFSQSMVRKVFQSTLGCWSKCGFFILTLEHRVEKEKGENQNHRIVLYFRIVLPRDRGAHCCCKLS